uniref:NADH-ubiquinone oxidoreductase chain 4L n=1 Tax=Diodora graeca TaxID=120387 RepID=A0A120HCV2_DIOGA|nr:NADH dehydrogenase subunit 4L [Diodora graeca]
MSVSFFCFLASVCTITSLLTICLQHKHLLMLLLSLEALLLSIFILLMAHTWATLESHACLILITMGVCEASLGLSILVALIRTHGNDYVYSLGLYKC